LKPGSTPITPVVSLAGTGRIPITRRGIGHRNELSSWLPFWG